MTNRRTTVIIAETSPIISLGIHDCLKQLNTLQINTVIVPDRQHLFEALRNYDPDLILMNPLFNGGIRPEEIRTESDNDHLKIIAITTSHLDNQSIKSYDNIISIADDLTTIQNKITTMFDSEEGETEEKETLSTREKEIVSFVVKGFTNKEIADKLFLSVHTVNTHRRNIARKLEIHSATGLTIYAIVNHLVDLSEIKNI